MDTDAKVWYNADSKKQTKEGLLEWIKEAELNRHESPFTVIVGTDSHLHGRDFRFVSVVLLRKEGKGANYWYKLEYEARDKYKGAQHNRMYKEVEISLEMCDWLLDNGVIVDEVHLDVNTEDAGEFTSAISNGLKGYVISRGYTPVIKPDSYVANAVADKHSK